MNYTVEVTQEEYDAIMKLRSQKQSAHQAKAINLLILTVSYIQWLRREGMGDTYSTFCDDFRYEPKQGEDRPTAHKNVMSVIRHAYELTV